MGGFPQGAGQVILTTNIYTLADPVSGDIRYVGKANDVAKRYRLHVRKDEHTLKSRWIAGLKKRGLLPVVEVLDVVPRSEWQFWEQHWIQVVRGWGFRLVNGDNGGLGSDRLSDALKRRIGDALRGRKNESLSRKVFMYSLDGAFLHEFSSVKDAGLYHNGSHGNICRAIKTGSPAYGVQWRYERVERIEPFVAAKRVLTEDRKEKLRAANTGRVVSEETRRKMRDARVGVSPANKGKQAPAWVTEKNRSSCSTRKAVVQYDLSGNELCVYPSVKAASLQSGATRCGIVKAARGEQRHAAGFVWRVL